MICRANGEIQDKKKRKRKKKTEKGRNKRRINAQYNGENKM